MATETTGMESGLRYKPPVPIFFTLEEVEAYMNCERKETKHILLGLKGASTVFLFVLFVLFTFLAYLVLHAPKEYALSRSFPDDVMSRESMAFWHLNAAVFCVLCIFALVITRFSIPFLILAGVSAFGSFVRWFLLMMNLSIFPFRIIVLALIQIIVLVIVFLVLWQVDDAQANYDHLVSEFKSLYRLDKPKHD